MKNFKIGDLVQSRFRAPWKGIVYDVVPRKGHGDLITTRMHTDRHGNPARARKMFMHTLDEHWLELLVSPQAIKVFLEERLPRPSSVWVSVGARAKLVNVFFYLRPRDSWEILEKAQAALNQLRTKLPDLSFVLDYR